MIQVSSWQTHTRRISEALDVNSYTIAWPLCFLNNISILLRHNVYKRKDLTVHSNYQLKLKDTILEKSYI